VVFEQCFKDIRANKTGQTGGVDSIGHPVSNITEALGITYNRCVEWCSAAPENFSFPDFSRKFTAWLLPWLALISQLPFNGSNDKGHDLLSVFLAVGSPTLAGYSLALTALNANWLNNYIKQMGIDEDATRLARVERVLNYFQTMRLEVRESELERVFKPQAEGSDWWENVETGLNYAPQGFVSAATALGWVFIAYVLTLIDAFNSLQAVSDTYGLGPGVSPDGISDGQGVGSIWLWLLPIVIGWLQIAPKYQNNYNKSALKSAGSRLSHASNTTPDTRQALDTLHYPIVITETALLGSTLHPDETHSAPIFNYARFVRWTKDVVKVLDCYKHLPHDKSIPSPPTESTQLPPPGRRFLRRFLLASLAGLTLQWGTAGGAIIIHWFTPTVGLGCRSLNWFLYAGTSTLVWMMLVASSFLVHFNSHYIRSIAAPLHTLGGILAACNAAAIIVTCVIQFGNFYNRCYCNSVVTLLKSGAYDIFWVRNAGDIKRPWVGGVALGVGTAVLFLGTINVWLP
jgi:hypothetical protein